MLVYLLSGMILLSNRETFGISVAEKFHIKCKNIAEINRQDCGYGGISPSECTRSGCCFLETYTPSVPWCFFANVTLRESESYDVTVSTVTQPTRNNEIPDWIKELLKVSSKYTNPKKSNIVYTSGAAVPTTTSTLTAEIEDELTCLKTYRLFERLKGNQNCLQEGTERIACVRGRLPRRSGESVCSACTKLDCCYDPITQRNNGVVAPHCFKRSVFTTTEAITTTTALEVTTTALTSSTPTKFWAGINPAYQPGGTPPPIHQSNSSKRMQELMNQLAYMRRHNGGSSGSIFGAGGTSSRYPRQFQTPLSPPRWPSLYTPDRPSSGLTSQSAARPEASSNPGIVGVSGNLYPPAGAPSNQLTSYLNRKTNSASSSNPLLSNGNTGTANLLSYFLKKRAEKSSSKSDKTSSVLNLLSLMNPSKGVAPGISPTSSSSSIISNMISSMKGGSSTSGSSDTNNLLKYLVNRNRPSSKPSLAPSSGQNKNSLLNYFLNKIAKATSSEPTNPLNYLLNGRKDSVAYEEKNKPVSQKRPLKLGQNNRVGESGIPALFEEPNLPRPEAACYPVDCGRRSTDTDIGQRIVGGQWSGGIEFWPWTGSLRRTFTDDNRFIHVCGATLVSPRWIVTAGHCFTAYEKRGTKLLGQKEKYVEVYMVHLGKYYKERYSNESRIFELDSFHPHPEFDFRSLSYDIAVAKLQGAVEYSSHIQPACLPHKGDVLRPGDRGWVAGWGDTMYVGDQDHAKLKELSLPLISTSQCKRSWPQHFHKAWICTEGAYLEDACAGDSGGPLVKRDVNGRWDLIGVAVAGTRTCSTRRNNIKPGIFTKVAYFRSFIDAATNGACDDETTVEKSALL